MEFNKKWVIIVLIIVVVVVIITTCVLFLNIHSVNEHKDFFSKSYNQKSIWFPYLTSREGYLLESYILNKLKENYECICQDKQRQHFPVILRQFDKKKKIHMSKCGVCIDKLSSKKKNIYKNIDFKPQIKCIIYNLNKNNIIHNDLKRKNITVQDDGTLGLIDFELAQIKNFCLQGLKSKNMYKKNLPNNYYSQLYSVLKSSRIGNNTSSK